MFLWAVPCLSFIGNSGHPKKIGKKKNFKKQIKTAWISKIEKQKNKKKNEKYFKTKKKKTKRKWNTNSLFLAV